MYARELASLPMAPSRSALQSLTTSEPGMGGGGAGFPAGAVVPETAAAVTTAAPAAAAGAADFEVDAAAGAAAVPGAGVGEGLVACAGAGGGDAGVVGTSCSAFSVGSAEPLRIRGVHQCFLVSAPAVSGNSTPRKRRAPAASAVVNRLGCLIVVSGGSSGRARLEDCLAPLEDHPKLHLTASCLFAELDRLSVDRL